VETFNLNKAVKRNIDRFPEDFMFQLTMKELEVLNIPNWNVKTGTAKRTENVAICFTNKEWRCYPRFSIASAQLK